MTLPWSVELLLFSAVLTALLLSGLWIAFALGLAGMIMLVLAGGPPVLNALGSIAWNTVESFVLTAVPLFLFMGEIILHSGISARFYEGVVRWFGRWRGGLLHCNIIACAIFAAVTGSSVATAAAIGTVAIPEMTTRGYRPTMTLGSLAGGGTLGILIPPSIVMIIYGALVEESVARLFIAGVLPGLVLVALFVAYIFLRLTISPDLAPRESQPISWGARLDGLLAIAPVGLLMVVVLGSIYAGMATPTEAAAIGASGALLLSLAYGRVTWESLRLALVNSVRTTCMVLLIIVGAQILSFALVKTGINRDLTQWVVSLELSKWALFSVVAVIYVILGFFVDGISMTVLTLPILYPIIIAAGFDPIWFGVVLVVLIELGQITPPMGLNIFVIQGISGHPLIDVVRGVWPYAILMLGCVLLLALFPQLATWLPDQMIGR